MFELSHLNEYETTPKDKRNAYVTAEIRKIIAAGLPLLTTILRCPDDDARSHALHLLKENTDEEGNVVLEDQVTAVRLRLHPDAKPPERDPQNRGLPEAKRGKVLVAKLGNKGGRLPPDASGKQIAQFSGQRRNTLVNGGADLYETAEITREWKSFGLRNATLILKTWGIGVQGQRALGYFDRDKGEMVETQSFYLVEEEPLVKKVDKGKADKAA